MQVSINYELYSVDDNASLQAAIDSLQVKELSGIAVALNEKIIPRSEWEEVKLEGNDSIVIIGAVAGG